MLEDSARNLSANKKKTMFINKHLNIIRCYVMLGMLKITFWGFVGSTLSHGSGFLVLFKLKMVNENVTLF